MTAQLQVVVNEVLSRVNPCFLIKPKQLECIINIMDNRDTLAILPTSYGKSLIYQIIPSICKNLSNQPDHAIVIVFSPLKSLVEDQVKSAKDLSSSLSLNPCRNWGKTSRNNNRRRFYLHLLLVFFSIYN